MAKVLASGRPRLFGNTLAVLVVDDKEIMLDILKRILRRIGLSTVDVAQDASTALEMLREKSYNLVISDLHMAPMSGLDFLKKIRADDRLRKTPFLMMSGEGDPYTLVTARQAGLDNFILKPFTPSALEEKLGEIF